MTINVTSTNLTAGNEPNNNNIINNNNVTIGPIQETNAAPPAPEINPDLSVISNHSTPIRRIRAANMCHTLCVHVNFLRH